MKNKNIKSRKKGITCELSTVNCSKKEYINRKLGLSVCISAGF